MWRLFEVEPEAELGVVGRGGKVIEEFKLESQMILVPVIDAAAEVRQIVVDANREEILFAAGYDRLP
jgi:hypothetical protein